MMAPVPSSALAASTIPTNTFPPETAGRLRDAPERLRAVISSTGSRLTKFALFSEVVKTGRQRDDPRMFAHDEECRKQTPRDFDSVWCDHYLPHRVDHSDRRLCAGDPLVVVGTDRRANMPPNRSRFRRQRRKDHGSGTELTRSCPSLIGKGMGGVCVRQWLLARDRRVLVRWARSKLAGSWYAGSNQPHSRLRWASGNGPRGCSASGVTRTTQVRPGRRPARSPSSCRFSSSVTSMTRASWFRAMSNRMRAER